MYKWFRFPILLALSLVVSSLAFAQSDDDREAAQALRSAADSMSQLGQLGEGSDASCAKQFSVFLFCQASKLESGSKNICSKPKCSFGNAALAELLNAVEEEDKHAADQVAPAPAKPSSVDSAGDDDSPILHAGNRQAADIRAVGDSNAAHRQAAAQQRVAGQQAQQVGSNGSSGGTFPPATETCPSMQAFPDMGAHCNPVRNMNQCVKTVSSTWTGNAGTQNFGLFTVVFANSCSQAIRLRATGPDNGLGQLQMVGSRQQFTYTESQHGTQFHYSADDGTDCFVNANRPGCGSN